MEFTQTGRLARDVTYFTVKWFLHSDKLIEAAKQNLTKGTLVYTSGIAQNNNYTDTNGNKQYGTDNVADDVKWNLGK